MFESLGIENATPREISVLFALALGVVFGLLAERTRFCFRRALIGDDRRAAAGVWAMAMITALIGTQGAIAAGWITFDAHRFMDPALPVLAILVGGLLFGAGMVLTRGCVSRLTVLTGSGNLRAALVLLVVAVTAHATLKGVLSPLRTAISTPTLDLGEGASLAALPGGALVWGALIVIIAAFFALRSGNRVATLLQAALLGLLVPLGWVGTGFVLFDEFDPIALQSLSFIAPVADGLFFTIASSAIPAGFGPGLIGGVVLGALASAMLSSRFAWQSFETPRQSGRYLTGAVLMGFGGVIAGGCTVGAGLSGVPTLSIAALLALAAIAAGTLLANALLSRAAFAPGAPSTTPRPQPAE